MGVLNYKSGKSQGRDREESGKSQGISTCDLGINPDLLEKMKLK